MAYNYNAATLANVKNAIANDKELSKVVRKFKQQFENATEELIDNLYFEDGVTGYVRGYYFKDERKAVAALEGNEELVNEITKNEFEEYDTPTKKDVGIRCYLVGLAIEEMLLDECRKMRDE